MLQGSFHDLLYVSTSVILLSMGLVISLRRHTVYNAGRVFLALYFWAYFLTAAITYVVLTPNLLTRLPHLARWAMFFFLLILPFSFLYVRANLSNKQFGWRDAWCFLPAFVYLVDYLPFFLKTGTEKLAIMQTLSAVNIRSGYQEGWLLPPLTWGWLRYLVITGFWIAQGRLIYTSLFTGRAQTKPGIEPVRNWFLWLQVTQLFIFLPSLILYLVDRRDLVVIFGNFGALIVAGVQGYFLMLKPEVLYGLGVSSREGELALIKPATSEESPDQEEDADSEESIPAYAVLLDESTLDEIGRTIEDYFSKKPSYLNASFKISELATDVGIPSHKLSAYFSRRLNMGFKDYINRLRIDNSVRKLELGEHHNKTLEAISMESGFQSRSTFIRAFKKFRGVTPSEFLEK